MKWYYWIGWVLFALSCVCDGYWLITEYHDPVSMRDKQDSVKIVNMIQEEHKGAEINDIQVSGFFPLTGFLRELALTKNENVALDKVKSVFYEVETDSTLNHYVTLFEVKNSFLNEEVGDKVFTCETDFFEYEMDFYMSVND
jgi:hypothetical protein